MLIPELRIFFFHPAHDRQLVFALLVFQPLRGRCVVFRLPGLKFLQFADRSVMTGCPDPDLPAKSFPLLEAGEVQLFSFTECRKVLRMCNPRGFCRAVLFPKRNEPGCKVRKCAGTFAEPGNDRCRVKFLKFSLEEPLLPGCSIKLLPDERHALVSQVVYPECTGKPVLPFTGAALDQGKEVLLTGIHGIFKV